MSDGLFVLPPKPFFSCETDEFSVVDGALLRSPGSIVTIEPMLRLRVGPGNVFEQRPRKVTSREGDVVTVACDDGVTIILDFDDFAARKQTAQGEFIYKGGLEEGSDGLGWMLAR